VYMNYSYYFLPKTGGKLIELVLPWEEMNRCCWNYRD
jgi:hypothetical protein